MSKILIDRAVVEQALDFCEFAWRDVPMNDYAFERLEQTIATLRAPLAEDAMQRLTDVQQEPEHITDGRPCWCEPELDYKDPETGVEVWVHRRTQ